MPFQVTVDETNTFGKQVEQAGTYNVKILPQDVKTSRNGNEVLVLDYEVLDGEYAGAQIRFDNMTWKDDTEESAKFSEKNFNSLAVATGAQNGLGFASMRDFAKYIQGKTINVTVEWREYNGKTNLSVKSKQKFDQEGSKPNGVTREQVGSTGNQAQATGANFGYQGAGQQGAQQGSFNPFQAQQGVNIADDDLPF